MDRLALWSAYLIESHALGTGGRSVFIWRDLNIAIIVCVNRANRFATHSHLDFYVNFYF
jgi:hypothetical protein